MSLGERLSIFLSDRAKVPSAETHSVWRRVNLLGGTIVERSRSGIFPHGRIGPLFGKGAFGLFMLALLFGPRMPAVNQGRALPAVSPKPSISPEKWAGLYAHLPLRFEENVGQTDRRADFLARGLGYTVFLTWRGAVLALAPGQESKVESRKLLVTGHSPLATEVVRLSLVGARQTAEARGLEELPGHSNYFIGNDPGKWHRNVATFAKVEYRGVYPGIDLVYYGKQGKLEYDFVVAAGADPGRIRLAVGADSCVRPIQGAHAGAPLRVVANGDLVVETDRGEVRFHKPAVYQEQESGVRSQESGSQAGAGHSSLATRHSLEGRYVLSADNHVHFEVPDYDRSRPLVIDPVLDYSSYIGGSGGDLALGIAVDSVGNAFITGTTNSSNFPTKSAFQASNRGSGDAFVSKFTFVPSTGTGTGLALVYSTYLGGKTYDVGFGIAVDSSGNAYVAGQTFSADFPTVNPFQGSKRGTDDAFIAKIVQLPVQLNAVVSRKVHGMAGTFDVDLPLTGPQGVECRSGGANGNYTLVFTFANALAGVGGASVTSGSGSVSSSAIGTDAHQYIVDLSGVGNAQYLTVSLTNVTDSAGNSSSAVSATMGVLVGDVNASGVVTSGDTNLCKAQALQPVTSANFRNDVNASGSITTGDVNLIKQNALTQLPPSP